MFYPSHFILAILSCIFKNSPILWKMSDRPKLVLSANRWSVLRAPSSRPHDPFPPNLLSETLFPVPHMALQTPEEATPEIFRILCYVRLPKRRWQRSKEGRQRGNSSLEKQRVRKAHALPIARLLNVTRWCSWGTTHQELGGRPGTAARSRGAEHAAWAGLPQLQRGAG